MITKITVKHVLLASAALLFCAGSHADVIKSVVNRDAVQYDTSGFIEITTAGGMATTFTAPSAGKYTIMFSATCYTLGAASSVLIRVLVDSAYVAPTSENTAYTCSYLDTGTRTVIARTAGNLTAGVHGVEIQGAISDGTSSFIIGPSTLIILK